MTNEDTAREIQDFQSHACSWCPLVESSYLANFDTAEQARWRGEGVKRNA